RGRFALFLLFVPVRPPTGSCPLSLHDALPILALDPPPRRAPSLESPRRLALGGPAPAGDGRPSALRLEGPSVSSRDGARTRPDRDRKSTRLNSSHGSISYAVFCLKKKHNLVRG